MVNKVAAWHNRHADVALPTKTGRQLQILRVSQCLVRGLKLVYLEKLHGDLESQEPRVNGDAERCTESGVQR